MKLTLFLWFRLEDFIPRLYISLFGLCTWH